MKTQIFTIAIILGFTASLTAQNATPQLQTSMIISAISQQDLSASFSPELNLNGTMTVLPSVNNGINAINFEGLGGLSLFVNQANEKLYVMGTFNQSGMVSFSMVGLDCTNEGHDSEDSYYAGKFEKTFDLYQLPNGSYLIQIGFESASGEMVAKTFRYQLSR
jgi:hypothetical protein